MNRNTSIALCVFALLSCNIWGGELKFSVVPNFFEQEPDHQSLGPCHGGVVLDEAGKTATLWTASEVIYKRMLKRGWVPIQDDERHAVFEFPRNAFKLPRQVSEARRKAGQAAAKNLHK